MADEKNTKEEETEKETEEVEEKQEEQEEKESEEQKEEKEYYEGVGSRKTSTAVVRIFTEGDSKIMVNEEPYEEYFPNLEMQETVTDALEEISNEKKFKISIMARGGGLHSQSEAIRHGMARALVDLDPSFKKRLKRVGYLTRDPRMKERKKPGKRGARRSPQWQKR